MEITEKQHRELEGVFKKYKAVFAYLFGSRATRRETGNSDFDIAVVLPEKLDKSQRFAMRCKMVEDLSRVLNNKNVEIVVLNDNNSILFKFVIIHEGKIIYEQDHGARVIFELKTMNDYYDFSPFIEAYNRAYLERALSS